VYESILVEPQFSAPFFNTMLGKSNTLENLKIYDQDYYSSLVKLMAMSASEITSTGLTFEANLNNEQEAVELLPGGSNKIVTKGNVIQYAHLVSHRLLNVQGAPQIRGLLSDLGRGMEVNKNPGEAFESACDALLIMSTKKSFADALARSGVLWQVMSVLERHIR
jgi:hypothetical protein